MEISAWGRRARGHATLLVAAAQKRYPHLLASVAEAGGYDAVRNLPDVHVYLRQPSDIGGHCSVARSCNRLTGDIYIIDVPSAGRRSFTALHELGHLLGEADADFQDALHRAGGTKRDSEEDACETFAALALFPTPGVNGVIDQHGLTAEAVSQLAAKTGASREACAVELAHRLGSPGYVLIVEPSGELRFAARSGDMLPLRRGSSQAASALAPLFSSRTRLRDRGRLCFAGGSLTDDLYVDACTDGTYIYAVAVTDTPDWKALQTLTTTSERQVKSGWLDGWCADCATEFTSTRRCDVCGDPIHDVCSRCGCAVPGVAGERYCEKCFTNYPARCFPGPEPICQEH